MRKRERTFKYDPNKKYKDRTDRDRVGRQTDEDMAKAIAEDPDAAPLLTREWFQNAELVPPLIVKKGVYLRLDQDVVDWFKQQGPRYQTRMNAVLRSFAEAHRGTRNKKRPARRKAAGK